jgi:hypothetical protein
MVEPVSQVSEAIFYSSTALDLEVRTLKSNKLSSKLTVKHGKKSKSPG